MPPAGIQRPGRTEASRARLLAARGRKLARAPAPVNPLNLAQPGRVGPQGWGYAPSPYEAALLDEVLPVSVKTVISGRTLNRTRRR